MLFKHVNGYDGIPVDVAAGRKGPDRKAVTKTSRKVAMFSVVSPTHPLKGEDHTHDCE